ncbi:DnaJ sub C member 27 [Boothiomyces sp. JEL0838]|nr:DnaJ sub C member 27 [Boothiomyces sp. JEL0838]
MELGKIGSAFLQKSLPTLAKSVQDITHIDANFCIAVIGSLESDKEKILEKEIQRDVEKPKSRINTIPKMYAIGEDAIRVEYWNAPDDPSDIPQTTRYISGLAGTIFFIDVTRKSALEELTPWMEGMKALGKDYCCFRSFLIGNKIDQPGRRVILFEDASEFAQSHDMEYFETSVTDDLDSIHQIFQSIVNTLYMLIPEGKDRQKVPVGLQLGMIQLLQ